MVTYIYDRVTGAFLHGGHGQPIYDPETQGAVSLPEHPNRRTDRYDAITRTIRPATEQEVAAWDAARQDAQVGAALADKKLIAMAEYYRQQLNLVRAALPVPLGNITAAAALDAIKTIYRAL